MARNFSRWLLYVCINITQWSLHWLRAWSTLQNIQWVPRPLNAQVIMVNWKVCLLLSLTILASLLFPVLSSSHAKKPTFPGEIMPLFRRKFTNSRGSSIGSSRPLGKLLHRNFIWSSSFFVISSAICTKKALNSASLERVFNGVTSAMLVDDRSARASFRGFLEQWILNIHNSRKLNKSGVTAFVANKLLLRSQSYIKYTIFSIQHNSLHDVTDLVTQRQRDWRQKAGRRKKNKLSMGGKMYPLPECLDQGINLHDKRKHRKRVLILPSLLPRLGMVYGLCCIGK